MYKRSFHMLPMLLIIYLTSSSTLAQTYGEIFTKSEANQRFGPISKSVTLQKSSFQGMLNQTHNYIMFQIIDGDAIILDSKRKVLYPIGKSIKSTEVFSVYSVSVMTELLNLGTNENLIIEQRGSVLTISNGAYTLEMAVICPPFCPDDDN